MIKYTHPETSKRDINKRLNNGFCSSAANHDKCWKCICERFRNAQAPCWCDEGLFYKEEIEDEIVE
jgi:hypothetical protein